MKKIGYISGRRIQGDLSLGYDPMMNRGGRMIIGEALTSTEQDYDEDSAVQNYALGTKMILPRGRVFHYAKAGGTLVPDMGVKNASNQYVVFRVVAAAAKGATQVLVTCTAADGIAANGTIAANELVGGHIVIFAGGLVSAINREVIANSAISVATTLVMTVTLDRPLPFLIGASTCEIMHSEYFNVQNDVVNYHSVVGLAMLPSAINRYLWLQTWGPTWMNAQLTVGESLVRVNNRQVVFRADGSLGLAGHTDVAGTFDQTTHYAQHAGYILCSLLGGAQGAPFVYLQIAP